MDVINDTVSGIVSGFRVQGDVLLRHKVQRLVRLCDTFFSVPFLARFDSSVIAFFWFLLLFLFSTDFVFVSKISNFSSFLDFSL